MTIAALYPQFGDYGSDRIRSAVKVPQGFAVISGGEARVGLHTMLSVEGVWRE